MPTTIDELVVTLGLDPTVTKVELPTIGVACPHEKGTGTGQCPNGGEDLPVKHVHRISDTILEYGYRCAGCGYESTLQMEGRGQLR